MRSASKKKNIFKKNKTFKHKKKIQVNNNFNDLKKPDTRLIPDSSILNYMKNNFNSYLLVKNENLKQNKNVIYLDDCFNFDDSLNSNEKIFTFKSSISRNPKMSLDKLISYSFYTKSPGAFLDNNNHSTSETSYLEILKNQMGKDIRRINITINDKIYNSELNSNENLNNFQVADIFYQILQNYYHKFSYKINFNIINKIALLSCQNMFNLITDLVSIKLNQMLEPEINSVFRPKKNISIYLFKNKKQVKYFFDAQLIISRDGQPIDPEYPCGNLLFNLIFDLEKNTFYFNEFKLNYNINKCGPEIIKTTNNSNNSNKNSNNENNISNNKNLISLKTAIPVALGIGGIVATPFILGAMGGKIKKIKINKNKNQ